MIGWGPAEMVGAPIRRNPVGVNRRRFFVSARTILIVRFDPGTTDDFDPDEILEETDPQVSQFLLARQQNRFRSLVDINAPTGKTVLPRGVNRSAAGALFTFSRDALRAATTSANANLASAFALLRRPDDLSRVLDVQPVRSSRMVNSYRKADELDLTLSWKSMPFDSRLIRGVLVFHYEGTVPADTWGTGQRELAPNTPLPSGYIVPATGRNLRFVGTVDEISDAHGAEGDILKLKCRDLSSILIDAKYPVKIEPAKIPTGTNILEIIRGVLDTNPVLSQFIRGPFARVEGSLPQLNPSSYAPRVLIPAKERHRQSATGQQPFAYRQPPKDAGKSSYWDVITYLCYYNGLRPYMEQDKLVLVEPRVLYKFTPDVIGNPGQPTFPTPYRQSINDTFPIRRMVFGSNVSVLRFHRKLARVKSPVVEVVSTNPDSEVASERLITVRHPPKSTGKRANNVTATGQPQENFHRVQLEGIIDRDAMLRIAKQVYEGMGRQELGCVVETDSVASFSDNPRFDPNEDPDLLGIRAGDPVRILVTPTEAETRQLFTLSELQSFVERARRVARATGARPVFQSAVEFLKAQGWPAADARQLVQVMASAAIPQEFRIITAAITFDGEAGGFNIQLDMRDYIRARADPDDSAQTGGVGEQFVLPGSPFDGGFAT